MKHIATLGLLTGLLASTSAFAVPGSPPGGGSFGIAVPVIAGMIFLDDQQRGEARCQAVSLGLHYYASAGQANCVPVSQMPWAPATRADYRTWSVQSVFPNY
jgi:hypothetical protein